MLTNAGQLVWACLSSFFLQLLVTTRDGLHPSSDGLQPSSFLLVVVTLLFLVKTWLTKSSDEA